MSVSKNATHIHTIMCAKVSKAYVLYIFLHMYIFIRAWDITWRFTSKLGLKYKCSKSSSKDGSTDSKAHK